MLVNQQTACQMNERKERIERLETVARRLEPTVGEFDDLLGHVAAYARRHIASLKEAPAYVEREDAARGLLDSPISEHGIGITEVLQLLNYNVDTIGINPASGRFMGYIPGGGLVHSALGDLLAAISNRYASVFFAGQGAVRMEDMLVRWMASIAGYPPDSAGFLSSGGSIANLSAIVAAREAHHVEDDAVERSVAYMTDHTHYCVDKAMRIAGLSRCIRRSIRLDENYRMAPEALEEAIIADKKAGYHPWLVVASAGTTNTGAVDPLCTVADIARAHGLWYHCEGAYGAFFVLCPEGREKLVGMGSSDSLVLDPHKTLFLPYGTGALLVRDRQKLVQGHGGWASFLQDAGGEFGEISSAFLSPELTKHFRGLRMWLPLKLVGVAPFRAALSEKIQLARYFFEELQKINGFRMGPYPDLSVVTYRFRPPNGDPDVFNQRLVERINQDGRVFLSSTRIQGLFVLRAAIVCFRTHRDDIDLAIEILKREAKKLLEE